MYIILFLYCILIWISVLHIKFNEGERLLTWAVRWRFIKFCCGSIIVLVVEKRNNVDPSHWVFNAGHLTLWWGGPKHVIYDVVHPAHHVSPQTEYMSTMVWVRVSLASCCGVPTKLTSAWKMSSMGHFTVFRELWGWLESLRSDHRGSLLWVLGLDPQPGTRVLLHIHLGNSLLLLFLLLILLLVMLLHQLTLLKTTSHFKLIGAKTTFFVRDMTKIWIWLSQQLPFMKSACITKLFIRCRSEQKTFSSVSVGPSNSKH